MNRRIVTAALSLVMVAACGGAAEEGGDADLGTGAQALAAAIAPIASTQDPVPARESGATASATTAAAPQTMVVAGAGGIPMIVVVAAATPTDPGSTVSSTQDPIPAKIRNEAKPNPDGSGPNGPK